MSLLKLYGRLRARDWLFVLAVLGLTVFQVWCTMTMTDYISSLVASIQYVEYHNDPSTVPAIYAIFQACGGDWAIVKEQAMAMGEAGKVLISVADASAADIWMNAGMMLLFAFLGVLAQIVIGVFASAITASIVTRIRKEFYQKVSSFSLEEINRFSTASLITRSTNDIEQIQWATLFGLRMLFSAPVTAIWASIKIQAVSTELTWVTLIGIIFIIVMLVLVMIFVFPKFKIAQTMIDRLNGITRESILGVRVVRAYNAEEYQADKFGKANKDYTKLTLFTSRMVALFSPVIILVLDGVTLGIYGVGASLLKKSEIAYSTIVSFSTLATMVIMAFMMLLMMFLMIPRAMVSAKRIVEVLHTRPTIVDPKEEKIIANPGAIEFDHVSFAYPNAGGNTLTDISFKANSGETVAIIGATGSGKTTFINLIGRLYDATEGSVRVGGQDVKDVRMDTLRAEIGFVPQKGMLFSGTVKSNVLLGLNDEIPGRLEEALDTACATEFVSQMEKGVDSPISSGGTNVSGGQRQRLCIARAVAPHPNILVFDDSFSALDFKTDRQVRKNLAKSFPNATKVIVAQRVGTIMDADLILVLDDGKLVGQGKHKELLHNCEIYREIALSQLSEEELGL